MKDILIIANYIVSSEEVGNGRFNYIAERLASKTENKVEIVSSLFSHINKTKREINQKFKNYKLTLLDEPGYKKNISIKRFYSHWILSKNLEKYLKKREKPDVIYCSVPSLAFAQVAVKYAKKNKIRIIIDIQDLWPEAFKMIFNPKIFGELIYYPLKKQADYIYKNADEIVAVSETYLKRGLSINKNLEKGYSVFLGNDLEDYERIKKMIIPFKKKNRFWLTYLGTLGHSYDIKLIIDSLKKLKEMRGISNIEFIILGDGPLKQEYEEYAIKNYPETKFIGRISYEEVVNYLESSDLVVNPIKIESAASIINKVGDYASAGIAVINTQSSREYMSLLEKYDAGINCKNDSLEIAEKIYILYSNEEKRKNMGKNNRKLAEEKFNRKITYDKIFNLILDTSNENKVR